MVRLGIRIVTVILVGLLAVPTHAKGQSLVIPPRDQQIAAAVLPLPADWRSTASVLGYDAAGKLVMLRKGTGAMTCLADDPHQDRFHVACYHNAMEPFMARGRELRSKGVKDPQVDSMRFKEVGTGTLKLPSQPASLYSLTGGSFDAAKGTADGARPLFVVYIPFATSATSGLSERPSADAPWIMFPGTPKAHIMFTPKM